MRTEIATKRVARGGDGPQTGRVPCALCFGPMAPWLEPGGHRLYWCPGCRAGRRWPVPTAADHAAAHAVPSYYTHADGPRPAPGPAGAATAVGRLLDRARIHLAWRVDHGTKMEAAWLARWLPSRGRLLDIGCGAGHLLACAAAMGHDSTGVEPDPAARVVAARPGVRVLDGTAENLPDVLRAERFDLVTMSHSLEHCLDPMAAVRGAAGLLAESGRLVLEVPNHDCTGLAHARETWPWLDPDRHLHYFTGQALRRTVERCGLAVETCEWTGYCRQFGRPWAEREGRGPWQQWRLLLATIGTRPERKYDSVRIIARRGR